MGDRGLRDIVRNNHSVDYIPLYQHGCTMYAMRDRVNVEMPFVQRAGLQEIGNIFILFCSG